MKRWKKYAGLLLALILFLSIAACGGKSSNEGEIGYEEEVSNEGEISIEDLEGFWYPPEGIGSTMSVLTCIYIDGTAETWEEYDQYGEPTECTGDAYTDGTVLTLTDVPLVGDVDIPIGDADTLVMSDFMGEIYYLVSDGQVLVHWADDGDNYYIHEDALDNVSLLTEYNLTNGSFWGEDYILEFDREYTVSCDFFSGETRTGTWEVDDNTVLIFWDDGETDEAESNWKTLYMSSTGETLENPW